MVLNEFEKAREDLEKVNTRAIYTRKNKTRLK